MEHLGEPRLGSAGSGVSEQGATVTAPWGLVPFLHAPPGSAAAQFQCPPPGLVPCLPPYLHTRTAPL